jgi:hypothetical protein
VGDWYTSPAVGETPDRYPVVNYGDMEHTIQKVGEANPPVNPEVVVHVYGETQLQLATAAVEKAFKYFGLHETEQSADRLRVHNFQAVSVGARYSADVRIELLPELPEGK